MDASRAPFLLAALALGACGTQPLLPPVPADDAGSAQRGAPDAGSASGSGHDAGTADAGAADAGRVDAGPVDAGPVDSGTVDAGTWRTSIQNCWTDVSCDRALLISHGGDWDVTLNPAVPYGSFPAYERAYDGGADAIKVDLRMTADNVAVAVHDSPLQIYDSLDCVGAVVEQMTAAQITQCHIFPSTTDTFPRIDDVLNWARGKMLVMLTVKDSSAFAGGIATAIANQAQDFVFVETYLPDMLDTIPDAGGWEQLHYVVEMNQVADIYTTLGTHDPRAFAYELLATYPDAGTADISALITQVIHPAGVKALVESSTTLPTVQNHLDLFNEGFDIIMTYDLANGVMARTQVDQMRGISPP